MLAHIVVWSAVCGCYTVGTKKLLYQTNELFSILFQVNISEWISKPGTCFAFLVLKL